MKTDTPVTIRRTDYAPPAFLVDTVDLDFDLDAGATTVRARLALRRNPAAAADAPLHLDGDGLTLVEAKLDGAVLPPERLAFAADGSLTIAGLPDVSVLETVVRIAPEENTSLSGLYTSGGNFYTQCEAEGFRRITFFPDRPDVMARYTVTITADKARVPGAALERQSGWRRRCGERRPPLGPLGRPAPEAELPLRPGRRATWSPCTTRFTTRSGRNVALNIYVRRGDEDRCGHAMDSLKRSMRWDEDVFGLEYDLDVFNIAAVSDFNMGAMENKGLNVFNTKYVLASPETRDRRRLPGHRDRRRARVFPQLDRQPRHLPRLVPALAEGRPDGVPRPGILRRPWAAARSSASTTCAACARRSSPRMPGRWRIRCGRTAISRSTISTRPRSTRRAPRWCGMLHTRIGAAAFRRAWTSTSPATTARRSPSRISSRRDAGCLGHRPAALLRLVRPGRHAGADRGRQLRPGDAPLHADPRATDPADARASPKSARADPGRDGPARPGRRADRRRGWPARTPRSPAPACCCSKAPSRSFIFEDVPAPPVPSLLRGFSAPVRLRGVSRDRLRFLAVHDTDPFVRWESGLQYAAALMLDMVAAQQRGEPLALRRGAGRGGGEYPGRRRRPTRPSPPRRCPCRARASSPTRWRPPIRRRSTRCAQHLRAEIGRRCGAALRATYDGLAETAAYRIDGPPSAAARCAIPASPTWPPPATRPRWPRRNSTPRQHDRQPRRAVAAGGYRPARRATRRWPPSMPAGAATTWCWTSGSPSRPWRHGRMRSPRCARSTRIRIST